MIKKMIWLVSIGVLILVAGAIGYLFKPLTVEHSQLKAIHVTEIATSEGKSLKLEGRTGMDSALVTIGVKTNIKGQVLQVKLRKQLIMSEPFYSIFQKNSVGQDFDYTIKVPDTVTSAVFGNDAVRIWPVATPVSDGSLKNVEPLAPNDTAVASSSQPENKGTESFENIEKEIGLKALEAHGYDWKRYELVSGPTYSPDGTRYMMRFKIPNTFDSDVDITVDSSTGEVVSFESHGA